MLLVRRHATKRICKRLGVPKTAVQGLVESAEQNGTPHNKISGSLRRYIDKLIINGKAQGAIVYRGYIFLTGWDEVITVWILPEKYKNRKAAN